MESLRTRNVSPSHAPTVEGYVPSVSPDEIEVIVLTEEEGRASFEETVAKSEFTWEELKEQARAGYFKTRVAHMTWYALAPFHQED